MFKLTIRLPIDRTQPGELDLVEQGGLVYLRAVECLGKADNAAALQHGNRTRNPLLPWGDTPLGTYAPARVITHDPPREHIGAWFLPLIGIGGAALAAAQIRTDLGVHGGRGDDKLIPTNGCVRLFNRHMAMLVTKLDGQATEIEIQELIKES